MDAPGTDAWKCIFAACAPTHNLWCRFIRGKIEGDTGESRDSPERLSGMLKSGRSRSMSTSRRMASLSVGLLQTMMPIAWLKVPNWDRGDVWETNSEYDEDNAPGEY